jgi:hypothetical protein
MPHAYTEEQLVEQPAIKLFGDLGWQTVSAMEEVFGAGGTLGRETPGEVVLATSRPRCHGDYELRGFPQSPSEPSEDRRQTDEEETICQICAVLHLTYRRR